MKKLIPISTVRILTVAFILSAVVSWLTVPQLVRSAYKGESCSLLNNLILQQDEHGITEYLAIAYQCLTVFSAGVLVLCAIALMNGNRRRRLAQNALWLVAPRNSRALLPTSRSTKLSNSTISVLLFIGVGLRLLAASRGFNYDMESYGVVTEVLRHGGNVYAETTRYNYGPIWFTILRFLDLIPWVGANALWVLRWKVACFLTLVDFSLSVSLYRWFGWRAAVLFWLNPVSIIITGYHSQFGNLAVLLALLSARLLQKEQCSSMRRQVLALTVLGLSLVVKHIFIFFPIWLAFKQTNCLKKFLYVVFPVAIFWISFLPYCDVGREGIIHNVLLYRSNVRGAFWSDIAPHVLVGNIPNLWLFVGVLILCGLLFRRVDPLESALRYVVVVVVFSPAMTNQYLAIPLAGIAGNWNVMYALYSLLAGGFLVLSSNGLHWPTGLLGPNFDELVLILFFGLVIHITPGFVLDKIYRSARESVARLKSEVVSQVRDCLPGRGVGRKRT